MLAPKVAGARPSRRRSPTAPPDFLVLFSSINAVTGGIGQVDYCAANAFLDAFAERGARRMPARISIDWCEWQWDAWTASSIHDPGCSAELERQRQAFGLSFEEGMEALARVLASGLRRVVVDTRDLRLVLAERHSLPRAGCSGPTSPPPAGGSRQPPPDRP